VLSTPPAIMHEGRSKKNDVSVRTGEFPCQSLFCVKSVDRFPAQVQCKRGIIDQCASWGLTETAAQVQYYRSYNRLRLSWGLTETAAQVQCRYLLMRLGLCWGLTETAAQVQ